MGFIAFLILGLIAGAIAKAILPGRQGGGWVITLVLGVVGAVRLSCCWYTAWSPSVAHAANWRASQESRPGDNIPGPVFPSPGLSGRN